MYRQRRYAIKHRKMTIDTILLSFFIWFLSICDAQFNQKVNVLFPHEPHELQLLHELHPLFPSNCSVALLLFNTSNSSNKKFVLLAKSTSPSSPTGLDKIESKRISKMSLLKFIIHSPKNYLFI